MSQSSLLLSLTLTVYEMIYKKWSFHKIWDRKAFKILEEKNEVFWTDIPVSKQSDSAICGV